MDQFLNLSRMMDSPVIKDQHGLVRINSSSDKLDEADEGLGVGGRGDPKEQVVAVRGDGSYDGGPVDVPITVNFNLNRLTFGLPDATRNVFNAARCFISPDDLIPRCSVLKKINNKFLLLTQLDIASVTIFDQLLPSFGEGDASFSIELAQGLDANLDLEVDLDEVTSGSERRSTESVQEVEAADIVLDILRKDRLSKASMSTLDQVIAIILILPQNPPSSVIPDAKLGSSFGNGLNLGSFTANDAIDKGDEFYLLSMKKTLLPLERLSRLPLNPLSLRQYFTFKQRMTSRRVKFDKVVLTGKSFTGYLSGYSHKIINLKLVGFWGFGVLGFWVPRISKANNL